ncbi:hypothetical protein MMC08_003414 [Hypocenomyce scalaris]|nr:hypothetical protein [Hypocenomyce scalaris]
MVLLKLNPSSLCDRQALLSISLETSSPALSLSNPEPSFALILTIRIESSSRPASPLTICTTDSVLDPCKMPENFDILARGAVSHLQCTTNPDKEISLGLMRPHWGRREVPGDMRERDWLHWLTVPAEGSAQVRHELPLSRIFQYEKSLKAEDVRPGEEYRLSLDDGYVGTTWWCWGDMEADLKDRKFSEWQAGSDAMNFEVEKPSDGDIETGGWTLGEDLSTLWIELDGGETILRFVE